jgi:microcystin-dependent protein
MGALGELCDSFNWQPDGTLTPDECAGYMSTMWEGIMPCASEIGQVAYFATQVTPYGWLRCDGAEYTSEQYPELCAAIDEVFKVTGEIFNTPDIRDRCIFSDGTEMGFGNSGGQRAVTLSIDTMPPHHHTVQRKAGILFPYGETPEISASGTVLEETIDTSTVGNGNAHDNMPPNITLRAYIRALP